MVPSDTPSCVASSLLLSPLAAARATSNCRRVSVPGPPELRPAGGSDGGTFAGGLVAAEPGLAVEHIPDAVDHEPGVHRLEGHAIDAQPQRPLEVVAVRTVTQEDGADRDALCPQRAQHGHGVRRG